ncbi:MAG: hypothetical protein NDJ94_21845 [Vicinamibacteria bacterium]|nr:hypothetical protein [Vicinamibacteria bacterium]
MPLTVRLGVLALLLTRTLAANGQEPAPTAAPEVEADRDASRFRRRHASDRYADHESRFSLQGYVTGTFADFGEDFPDPGFPEPGQLLVPRTNDSSFQYDWALFLGSRLSERFEFVVETHFVTAGDGSFEPDITTTEANVTWLATADGHALRLSMGQFWAPFAGVNDDWFSAVNLFSTVPYAARAFPLHYNERGLKAEGEFDLGGNRGLNYAVSLGNGVSGFALSDQYGVDQNGDKTVQARVGFYPVGPRFEFALSGATGRLRDGDDGARLDALAVDARYEAPRLEARGYALWSFERPDAASPPDLARRGAMLEAAVRLGGTVPGLREIWAKGRYDRSRVEQRSAAELDDEVFAFGLDVRPERRVRLKLEAFRHRERDGRGLSDDGVAAQLTASF